VPEAGCNVELRRSARAKRFSLKVSHTERAAILTLPNRGRVEDATAFLARHADWLRRQLERLPQPVPFEDGAVVPLRGEMCRLNFVGSQRNTGVVSLVSPAGAQQVSAGFADTSLRCGCSNAAYEICISGEKEHAPRRFSDWLRHNGKRGETCQNAGSRPQTDRNPRSINTMGVLFDKRYTFFFMAAHICAAICFGLRRSPRSGSSARNEPRPALLAPRSRCRTRNAKSPDVA
jgi:hypothetical protein